MFVVFLTGDLVFPSRVAGVVQRLGGRMETAASAEALIAKVGLATSDLVIVLLDLNSSALDPAQIVTQLKELASPPRAIIAFGPHVHEAKLAAAQQAGCDLVLSRGQFDKQMDSIVERYCTAS